MKTTIKINLHSEFMEHQDNNLDFNYSKSSLRLILTDLFEFDYMKLKEFENIEAKFYIKLSKNIRAKFDRVNFFKDKPVFTNLEFKW